MQSTTIVNAFPNQPRARALVGREGSSHEMPGEGGEEKERKAKFMGSRERRGERLRTAKWERKNP